MIFLGDTHGYWPSIAKITNAVKDKPIVHLGDVGLGFGDQEQPETFPDNFYFIRGNHDAPISARAYSNYLGDYGYNKKLNLFFISGADSIDKAWRVEGKSWWRDEQLSLEQLCEAYKLYVEIKPKIVVSHTAPNFVTKLMVRKKKSTPTEKMMEKMWNNHRPRLWVFAHWHPEKLFDMQIRETRFVCVPIDQAFVLPRELVAFDKQ